jgi:hypothetical protein
VNSEALFCAAGVLSVSPLSYFMRRDDSDLVVFCFANPEDVRGLCQALRWEAFACLALTLLGQLARKSE